MVEFEIDTEHCILTVSPKGPLSEEDFVQAGSVADPIILKRGELNGLIIRVGRFPG